MSMQYRLIPFYEYRRVSLPFFRAGLPVDETKLGLTDAIRHRIESAVASEAIGSNVVRLKPIKDYLDEQDGEEVSYGHLR